VKQESIFCFFYIRCYERVCWAKKW